MNYRLILTKDIRAIEMVYPHHLKILGNMINSSGIVEKPLIVDNLYNIVLDGSHRHVFFAMEGYKYTPVIKVDYSNPHIRVGTHLKHRFLDDGNIRITKEEVINRALSHILFPPRTTRNFFSTRKESIDIPLSSLQKGKPIDMSSHIANVDISVEIEHNKKYIEEIEEEEEELGIYIKEQQDTKSYLLKQIKQMEKDI